MGSTPSIATVAAVADSPPTLRTRARKARDRLGALDQHRRDLDLTKTDERSDAFGLGPARRGEDRVGGCGGVQGVELGRANGEPRLAGAQLDVTGERRQHGCLHGRHGLGAPDAGEVDARDARPGERLAPVRHRAEVGHDGRGEQGGDEDARDPRPGPRSDPGCELRHEVESSSAAYTPAVRLRDLPSVDELARDAGDPLAVEAARAVLARAREEIQAGVDPGDLRVRLADELAAARTPSLTRVLNATGVIVHTNLGRAPLAEAALDHVREATRGYSNLEFDLTTGSRGSRQDHVAGILRRLTGAESALVVNNNAAAVLLALAALGEGREVIVSRGELIEIGDGFRIPDVLARSGARLVEVGTTNRTRAADYERAIGPETAVLLRVHQSNFRVVGFTEQPRVEELAAVARRHVLPLVDDLGSGVLEALDRRAVGARGARRRRRPRLLQRRQAARRPAGGDRRGSGRPRRTTAAASAAARAPRRQADDRCARRNAPTAPRRARAHPGPPHAARARCRGT